MDKACVKCKHWDLTADSLGNCHRHAPRPAVLPPEEAKFAHQATWPETYEDDWCSEFELLDGEEEKPDA